MLKLRWLISIILPAVLLCSAVPVFAAGGLGNQQDPQSAQEQFSTIALLNYYSSSLDYIIQLDRNGSDTNLASMPFVNIPPELEQSNSNFAAAGIEFTASLVSLFKLWNQQNVYITQGRLPDASAIYSQINDLLPSAQQQLSQIDSAVLETGKYLNVDSLSSDNGLKLVYNEILTRIQQLSRMLNTVSLSPFPSEMVASLKTTALTVNFDTDTAYVGDTIGFTGGLSSQGSPLSERQVALLVNNVELVTVQTDAQGQFQGTFQLPYLYVNQISIQAVYYPEGNDVGTYLAGTSLVLNMKVLFYTTQLTLKVNGPSYPGKDTMITGTFDYGNAPILSVRTAELYLDNNLQQKFETGPALAQNLTLPPQITLGKHLVTISVPADGRYAPELVTANINVNLAATNINVQLPRLRLIPGSFLLSGTAYSTTGPLSNAQVTVSVDKVKKQVTIGADGTFSSKIGLGLGLSLLGTQVITFYIQPQEPWNAPVTATKNIFLINYVNLFLVFIILGLLIVFLPRHFKKWFSASAAKGLRITGLVVPVSSAVNQNKNNHPEEPREQIGIAETSDSMFYWYHLALKLVQTITNTVPKPNETLREYENDTNRALGPAGKYFAQLTYLIENRLYGRHKPDVTDVQKSKELSLKIQKEAGLEK
jgi:hypothetical protein